MRWHVLRFVALALFTLTIAACNGDEPKAPAPEASTGDGGASKWLSTGGSCDEMANIEANPTGKENLGLMLCGNAGHSFTGELRCARNFVEVGCR